MKRISMRLARLFPGLVLNRIRRTDAEGLRRIMGDAEQYDLHAKGRRDWVEQNADRILLVLVHPYIVKSRPVRCYRCDVAALMAGDGASFWVDVLPDRLVQLPVIRRKQGLRETAVLLIRKLPFIAPRVSTDLDPDPDGSAG